MKRYSLSVLTVLLASLFLASAQDNIDWKERFKEANSYFLYEEYNECLPIYLQMLTRFPNNHNIRYRIGVCYLNTPGEKNKAIEYLERASRNISERHRGENLKETNAPPEALFRLGDAYRVNYELDKALEAYRKFSSSYSGKKYNLDLVDEQIQACINAKGLINKPLFLNFRNLGDPVNSRFSDYNPVVSADGRMLLFMRKLQFYDAVFFSKNIDGEWSNPENLTFQLGEDEDLYTSSISADGTELFLYKIDEYIGNIYVSYYDGQQWSRVKKLNDNINTKYWESHASVSHDGKSLYFTSNRKGGYGGLDIYVSHRDSAGAEWGPAKNLGPVINTSYNEETPFISADNQTLYFSSYGHFNIGGYDIFYSNLLDNDEWSAPMNMGYPINTPDDDLFYFPVGEGYYAYYSKYDEEGIGQQDIFLLEIYSDEHPKKYLIKGMISLKPPQVTRADSIRVIFIDRMSGDTLALTYSDSLGNYELKVPHGTYDIYFEAEGFDSHKEMLAIEPFDHADEFGVNATLHEADLVAEMEILDSLMIITDKRTLKMDLRLEKDSRLMVETIRDSVVVNVQEFDIRKEDFTYKLDILPGRTDLRFSLTDSKGNIATDERVVIFEPPKPKPRPVPRGILNLLDELRAISGGSLKQILEETEPLDAGIYSQPDLRRYLVEKSNNPAGVDSLFLYRDKLKTLSSAQMIELLRAYSEGELKTLSDSLDLSLWRRRSTIELVEYLNREAEGSSFDDKTIRRIVLSSPAPDRKRLDELKEKLEQAADGTLKTSLEELKPEAEGITNNQELVEFLIGKAEIFGYEKEEVFRLVTTLASGGKDDVMVFLKTLTEAADGALKDFLLGLDPDRVRTMTPENLLEYIISQSVNQPYTADQVWEVLFRLMEQHADKADKVIETVTGKKSPGTWFVWLAAGAALLFIFLIIVFRRKRKKQTNSEEQV